MQIDRAAYALPLRELSSLVPVRKIVELPEAPVELLGVIGHRGAIVPAFDLATLIGHRTTKAPRWLALVDGPQIVAFAFEELEGLIEVDASRVHLLGADDPRGGKGHVKAVLASTPVRGIIRVESLLDAITHRER
jgi:chemotaxis signal transduction protein